MFEELWQELDNQPTVEGITIIDATGLPDPLALVLKLFMRHGAYTSSALANELTLTHDQMQLVGDRMVEKGLLIRTTNEADGELIYNVRLVSTKGRKLRGNLFGSLEEG